MPLAVDPPEQGEKVPFRPPRYEVGEDVGDADTVAACLDHSVAPLMIHGGTRRATNLSTVMSVHDSGTTVNVGAL